MQNFRKKYYLMFWCYSVFQGFSKAKSANGGFDLKLELIFDTAQAASKNKARFKVLKVDSKIIISLPKI